jgi:ribosomal 50S subunit-recycling heat shock protein
MKLLSSVTLTNAEFEAQVLQIHATRRDATLKRLYYVCSMKNATTGKVNKVKVFINPSN